MGELVSVGFMRRCHPGFTAMKGQLDSGTLGVPLLALGSHRNVRSYPTGGSEGTLTNSAVHDIDVTEWLLGSPITEVGWYAPRSTSLDHDRHDPQLIHLRTMSGVLTSIDLFVNAQYGYEVRYELVCEKGISAAGPDGAHRHRPRPGPRLRPRRRLASLLRRRLPAPAPGLGRRDLHRSSNAPCHGHQRAAVHHGGPSSRAVDAYQPTHHGHRNPAGKGRTCNRCRRVRLTSNAALDLGGSAPPQRERQAT